MWRITQEFFLSACSHTGHLDPRAIPPSRLGIALRREPRARVEPKAQRKNTNDAFRRNPLHSVMKKGDTTLIWQLPNTSSVSRRNAGARSLSRSALAGSARQPSRPVRRGRTPTMVRFQRPMSKGSPPGASILMTDGEWENFWAMLEARRGEIPTQRAPTTILPTRSPLHQTMNRLQQEGEWGAAESGLKMRPHKTHHRCGTCKGCTSSDCGLCKNCRDKPRYAICVLLSAEAVASGRDGARLARSPGPNLRLGTLLDHIPRPRRVGASPACSPAPRARPAAPEAPEKCQARAHAPVPLHERPRRPPIARLVAPPLSTP